MNTSIAIAATALVIFAAIGLAGRDDIAEQQAESKAYCEAVQRWKDTHGRYGHPAYRGQQECKEPQ